MINLTTANSALKTVYLDVLSNLLNLSTNPLFAKIKQTTQGVYGKEIKVLAPYGINGGISATSETGELPQVGGNGYLTFTSELKNLYGRLEISDKAVRASQNSAGAFVNLLNDEMEGLIRASQFNLSRMLFGDGRGYVAQLLNQDSDTKTVIVKDTKGVVEGMIVDIYDEGYLGYAENARGLRVVKVDRKNNKITFDRALSTLVEVDAETHYITIQNSLNNEITGINALFRDAVQYVYGLKKTDCHFVKGSYFPFPSNVVTEMDMVECIDKTEEYGGTKINYIATQSAKRRAYQTAMLEAGRNIQTIDIGNGFKALDFYGIPFVTDKFVNDDQMVLLDTDCFTLHQMCDWEWMCDDNGNVLTQKGDYPVYTATLVKYADLICSKPMGQACLYY